MAGLALGCAAEAPEGAGAKTDTGSTAPAAAAASWDGRYALRGTLEGGRQATGELEVEPLAASDLLFQSTKARVQRTYPSYDAPFYRAQLRLAHGSDSLRGRLTCAHGPAAVSPPLVCDPVEPLSGLEEATLVVSSGGTAILAGSHGEGVSIEFGRFRWERSGAP